jgi:Domain of Unknown Function (DUF1521)
MSQLTIPFNPLAKASSASSVPSGGLRYLGNNQYETQRYLITVNKGEVTVFDKQTKTSVKAWGDPHVTTGDGDKMQFHKDNLTLDLQDGTKLTLKPTKPDANGIALIDSLAIMTPNGGGELIENIANAPTVGKHFDSSIELDRLWSDGTVLRAGKQVDDLFYASSGKEIVGGDPNAKFGEHALDGKGGTSAIDFMRNVGNLSLEKLAQLPIADLLRLLQPNAFPQLPQLGDATLEGLLGRVNDLIKNGGAWQTPANPQLPGFSQGFGDMRQLIAALLESLNRVGAGNKAPLPQLPGFGAGDFQLPKFPQPSQPSQPGLPGLGGSADGFKNQVLGQMRGLDGQINAMKSALASGKVPPEMREMVQLELQELMQQKKQLLEMLTNIMKSEHEMAMSVIRNLAV